MILLHLARSGVARSCMARAQTLWLLFFVIVQGRLAPRGLLLMLTMMQTWKWDHHGRPKVRLAAQCLLPANTSALPAASKDPVAAVPQWESRITS
jgi:hypothetical protein